VIVEAASDHKTWLGGGLAALSGEELWAHYGCTACHVAAGAGGVVGQSMDGVFGAEQALESGETVLADEDFLRESILDAGAAIIKGYAPAMPLYADKIGDEELAKLIDYIKSLSTTAGPAAEQPPAGAETQAPEAGEPAEEVVAETMSTEAQTILFIQNCVGCHGKQLEGIDGPILVGLDPEYIKANVRSGNLEFGMIPYGPELVSDENLAMLAGEIAGLSLRFTGVKLSQAVLDALTQAQEALDAGDKAGVEAGLQAALAAASDAPEGVVTTLNVMIAHLEQDDWADYTGNRLAILLGS
jgi:mono/diheme cytochrome c family protein